MLAVLVHKDNPDVCSDPMSVAPGGTRATARKNKEKTLNEERVMGKASCPVKTHGDVEHQIKKARIQGMHLHVAKIGIDAIIAQVSALRENKDVLIEALGREQFDAQIVHLLGQLPGLPKIQSSGGGENVGDEVVVGEKSVTSGMGSDVDSDS